MKILLLANYVPDGQESMQRFAALMEKGLTAAGHEVCVCRPTPRFGKKDGGSGKRKAGTGHALNKWLGYVDKFLLFPSEFVAHIEWADVVHICDHSNSMYAKYLQAKASVVTCHDLLAVRSALGEIPQNPTSWTGRQLQRWILRSLAKAQRVVCVSEATRIDVLRLTGLPEDRVSRSYNALNYAYVPMSKEEAFTRLRTLCPTVGPQPFFLHIGGNQWYKNRLGVLRLFQSLRKKSGMHDFQLIMVGKPWADEMRRFVAEFDLQNVTVELTAIGGEDLRALYSLATMMLFPSLAEGFGWPIVEAQACGCPVVTSHRPPMSEVGGDAAIYVDPDEPESAAEKVAQAWPSLASYREAGLRNAARFAGNTMIDDYLALYETVIQEHSQIIHSPQISSRFAASQPGQSSESKVEQTSAATAGPQ